ncbi:MAG: hypothetical protein AAF391_08715, partial [Bacteroidota bacterium]
LPDLTEEFIRENGIQMIDVDMNVDEVPVSSLVYNSLHDPLMKKGSMVVRSRYSDETSYEEYLSGLNEMKNAFYRFYDERAQELFGKSFYEINREQFNGNQEAKQQYRKTREGYPMSIVVEKR